MIICSANDAHLPLIGISACLAGQRVRYDGADHFNVRIAQRIAPHCRLLAFCPEAVAGLGIPRPPVNLVLSQNGLRAIGREPPHRDVTDRLHTVAGIFARTYPALCGFILQSRSPSCGLGTAPVYSSDQQQILDTRGSGLFAAQIQAAFPGLPMLDDRALDDATISTFLAAVSARQRRTHSR